MTSMNRRSMLRLGGGAAVLGGAGALTGTTAKAAELEALGRLAVAWAAAEDAWLAAARARSEAFCFDEPANPEFAAARNRERALSIRQSRLHFDLRTQGLALADRARTTST